MQLQRSSNASSKTHIRTKSLQSSSKKDHVQFKLDSDSKKSLFNRVSPRDLIQIYKGTPGSKIQMLQQKQKKLSAKSKQSEDSKVPTRDSEYKPRRK